MALEAVFFQHDVFNYTCKDLYSLAAPFGASDDGSFGSLFLNKDEDTAMNHGNAVAGHWETSPSSNVCCGNLFPADQNCVNGVIGLASTEGGHSETIGRRKRRRSKGCKNKEEMENQRMTHIAVERNRRKQMNEYLAVLRSLMPSSYVQRGDQASIVGGAINFVKELEQLLQTLEAQRRIKMHVGGRGSSPFSNNDSFTFSHYNSGMSWSSRCVVPSDSVVENRSRVADVEVTLVESHANLKILSAGRPRQLLKLVADFQSLHLTILHLNVTTVDQMVLYSVSAKVEEQCQVTTVDEIATAVHQIMGRIHADSVLP